MGYKTKYAIKKSRPIFIVVIALWIFSSIFFLPPLVVARVLATASGAFHSGTFLEALFTNFGDVGANLTRCFSSGYIGTYLVGQIYLIIFLAVMAMVGILKTVPKHEYSDIEHGSSDWCEKGEEYTILHRKKGILLAEKEYLPVDKRGNVNVLVVGRIRVW